MTASRLQQVLGDIAVAVRFLIPMPDLRIEEKWRKLASNQKPPRVVFVRTSDTFGPSMGPVTHPRAFATRFAGVDAHCWGRDERQTEDLAHALVLALRMKFGSSQALQLGGGRWVTEEAEGRGYATFGEVYALSFSVGIPVVQSPWDSTPVIDVAFDANDAALSDGIIQAGET